MTEAARGLEWLPQPDPDRLAELFLALASLPSPSRQERAVADLIIGRLAALGLSAHEDDTGAAIGGDTGNLCLTVGTGSPCLALAAHMDTVLPSAPLEPYLEDGIFRNRQPTILGADDKAAVTVMLHVTELLIQSGLSFPAYDLCFTVAEEVGLQGAKHLAEDHVRSPLGAVFDSSGAVGGITVRAPSQETVQATFRGKAAHAGLEPELGRNAIQAAARAIARMELGRLDEETTANVGVINGGVATNIVPDHCVVRGECRSLDEGKLARLLAAMVDDLEMGAAEVGVDVDIDLVHEYTGYSLTGRSPIVRLSKAAVAAAGLTPALVTSGGGSDANVFNVRGIPTVNLDCGMTSVHTADESLALVDLVHLSRVALSMIALAPDFAPGRR